VEVSEINQVAHLISTGYYHDKFFKWSVDSDTDRHSIVADYYKVYLRAKGCVAYVVENQDKHVIGASVWLPHDVDTSIYDEIDRVVGEANAPQFRAVADKSHLSEPPMSPFYQLVGFVILPEIQGQGVGAALLKHSLDKFDKMGIPTYLEASTPYFGGGVYGKFGYHQVGELMIFAETAVLYPLWRPAAKVFENTTIHLGGYDWIVLEKRDNKMLLISEKVIHLEKYHDTFENISWCNSTAKHYLNTTFKTRLDRQVIGDIFLLSVDEVMYYFGDNNARKAVYLDGSPCRWALRTQGNMPYLVATVTIDGKISTTGDFVNRESSSHFKVGLRPAFWIDFS